MNKEELQALKDGTTGIKLKVREVYIDGKKITDIDTINQLFVDLENERKQSKILRQRIDKAENKLNNFNVMFTEPEHKLLEKRLFRQLEEIRNILRGEDNGIMD